VPDINIPDVFRDPDETMENSNYTLFEDADDIFFLWNNGLYIINKNDGNVKTITNDCPFFTVCNKIIYYVGSDYCSINKYNLTTGKTTQIVKSGLEIYGVECYNNKLYFARESGIDTAGGEAPVYLYSSNLDGSKIKRLLDDAFYFAFYKNRMFYTESGGADGAPLHEFDVNSHRNTLICEDAVNWYFEASYGKVFYDNKIYDIIKKKNTDCKPLSECDTFTMDGQYLLYYESSVDQATPVILYAYDVNTMKTYSLSDITDIYKTADCVELHTALENVYITAASDRQAVIYRIDISGGKASIKKIAQIII
jgi:nitrite reductase/ring-hydroxylating ferredoxin subunit